MSWHRHRWGNWGFHRRWGWRNRWSDVDYVDYDWYPRRRWVDYDDCWD